MKQLITALLVLLFSASYGQVIDTTKYIQNNGSVNYFNGKFRNSLIVPVNADTISKIAGQVKLIGNTFYFVGTDKHWHPANSVGDIIVGSGSSDTLPFGGAITSVPTVGFNPNTRNISEWITNSYYASQNPTATITGGTTLELRAAGADLSLPVTWTAGRLAATQPLSTVVVQGVNKTFAQPSPGATTTAVHNAVVPINTNTTVTINVATTDAKTATASTTFTFSPKRYFGWVNSATPSDADILATTGEFSTVNAKTWTQSQPTGSQNLVYAKPTNQGPLTEIIVNGFPSIAAFDLIQRSFTNALGYSQSYDIYVSINKFNITGNTTVAVQ